jgi:hypothetical protein
MVIKSIALAYFFLRVCMGIITLLIAVYDMCITILVGVLYVLILSQLNEQNKICMLNVLSKTVFF